MMELMDAGKNWEIPPRTMSTPTTMLTIRLGVRVSLAAVLAVMTMMESGNGSDVQDVGEIHFRD